MAFKMFSSNKKVKKPELTSATDFLNPAAMEVDIHSQESIIKDVDKTVKADNKKNSKSLKAEQKRQKKEAKLLAKQKKREQLVAAKVAKKEKIQMASPELEIKVSKTKKPKKIKQPKSEVEAPVLEERSEPTIKETTESPVSNEKLDREDLSSPKVLEINLIKDQISVFFDWYKNLALLIVFVFLSLALVGEVYWGLAWWQNYSQNDKEYSDNNLANLNQEIRDIKDKAETALAFQDKLTQVNYLLDNHIYWTNFFNYLESNTVAGVKYNGFSGDIFGSYVLSATADSFPTIGRQVQQFSNTEYATHVQVDSGQSQGDDTSQVTGVSFEVNLDLNPDIFKQ